MLTASRAFPLAVLAAALAVPATLAQSASPLTAKQARLQGSVAVQQTRDPLVGQLIVRLRSDKTAVGARAMSAARVQALSTRAGLGMKSMRTLASGSQLMQFERALPLSQARAVAARLSQDPDVLYAEPNVQFKRLAVPNEPRYTQWQWNLFAPTTSYTAGTVTTTAAGGANLPPAWDYTTGVSDVVVAVIDTGIVNHSDLNGVPNSAIYLPQGRFLAGYDFVSSDAGVPSVPVNFVGNDGNGRDADPSDPGDWITASDKALYPDYCDDGAAGTSDSSWHGTHMTGVVAATANNSAGIAGVGWNLRVQPIRALGKCGGSLSDIADAVRWAAGAQPLNGLSWQQNGVTIGSNPTPAKVINLSLGGDATCSPEMQSAVDAAIAAGAVIVAATGNIADPADKTRPFAPSNCSGVIAVTAHTINGENAVYAVVGTGTTISAPGGGPPEVLGSGGPTDSPSFDGYYIHSTVLFGPTSPTSATASGSSGAAYAGFTGTSAATPHVAGVAALIRSLAPSLTPAQVRSILSTAGNVRPYPVGSVCASGGLLAGQCGAGLLDADKALTAAGPEATPAAAAGSDQIVTPGTAVTLSGTASKAFFGKTITAYQWTQTAGTPTVTLATPAAATTSFTAPATGTLTFRLRVTDDAGKVGDDFVNVRVNSAPVLAAAPAAPTAAAGSVVSFAVAATDVDGDPLTFAAAAGSTVPFLALSPSGQFSWNTTGLGAGTYQLVYFATDGTAQSSTQTVTITLTGGSSANAPSGGGGGGGGGAMPWLQLLLVSSLLAARGCRKSVGQRER